MFPLFYLIPPPAQDFQEAIFFCGAAGELEPAGHNIRSPTIKKGTSLPAGGHVRAKLRGSTFRATERERERKGTGKDLEERRHRKKRDREKREREKEVQRERERKKRKSEDRQA